MLPHSRLRAALLIAPSVVFASAAVGHGKPGSWNTAIELKSSTADLALDRKRGLLILPILDEGRVEIHPVPGGGSAGAPTP